MGDIRNARTTGCKEAGTWLAPLQRKLRVFATTGESELQHLAEIAHLHAEVPPGTDLVTAGQPFGHILLLNEGWAIRYRTRSDGRRQIANIILPGDFMCLGATVMDRSDYDITTVTSTCYSAFKIDDFVGLIQRQPIMCAAIFWSTAGEEAILLEHLVSLGRRSAFERVAHLLLEIWRRLQIVGLADDDGFWMPLNQELIADCVGLTSIHVNRMMRAMQTQGLIDCQYRPVHRCRILEPRRLEIAAGFEDGYLHFTEMPSRTRNAFRHLQRS